METCLKSVSAFYSPQTPQACVRNLSLPLAENGVTALLGESGSGKTSILRLFSGFLRPASGSVVIDGIEVASNTCFIRPEDRKVGVLFQDYALFPHLNVTENILFGVSKKLGQEAQGNILADLLDACKLSAGLAERRPHELSGGQMQRVALARVLASRPHLLILDEPFSSVDAELRERMLAHIKQLVEHYRMRMLYITHDKNEAFQIAQTIAIIRDGELLQQGSPRDLYERPCNAYVARYLDKANILPLEPGPQYWSSPVGRFPMASISHKVEGTQLCLRPHELTFCPEPRRSASKVGEIFAAQARVLEQRYYGSYSEVYCISTEFPKTSIIVRGSASEVHQAGDIVHIRPLSLDFHFLP
ncbi:MAG: ABC transporter ATP-binding protein [Spirochaetota bacterium]